MTAQQPRSHPPRVPRRVVLLGGGALAVGATGAGPAQAFTRSSPAPVPATEDLMREHGVLKRVLLVYRELIRRFQAGEQLPAQPLRDAALIIHDYIEGFHEGLEEGYVFPRLRRAGQLTSTVSILLVQHARGRELTQLILSGATPKGIATASTRARLAAVMTAFDRMYEPHEAREDTVVFPAFRRIVPAKELADLGQHFAELENQQFGAGEFDSMVGRVAEIERTLGIYDLAQFTPQTWALVPGDGPRLSGGRRAPSRRPRR